MKLDPQRWQRIKRIVEGALEREGAEREAYLAARCAGDPELLGEVNSLIAADARAGGFLDPTVTDVGPVRDREATPFALPEIPGYRLLRSLGAGGMGAVYEAIDEKMKRRVALKVMARHGNVDKAARRFEQEAWIAGRLDHPNLVKVYDRGEWQDLRYYSMELIDGGSLHEVLRELKQSGRSERVGFEFGSRDHLEWAVRQVIAAIRGLDHAHRHGVVHRDIKPMNLLLSGELKTVKVTDFGVALDVDGTRLTSDGRAIGTLSYMAPEQLLGKQDEIDVRADVYALGVTLFELVTGELPYRGDTQPVYMNAVLTGEARRARTLNRRIDRDLEVVIGKALEKDPRDRYATVAELAIDLENVLGHRPIRARRPSAPRRLGKWARRRPVHAVFLVVLVVVLPGLAMLGQRSMTLDRLHRQQQVERLERNLRDLGARGDSGRVVETATRVLELDHDNVWARLYRASAFASLAAAERGSSASEDLGARAVDDVERVVRLNAESAWPYRWQAWILRQLGREDEAAIAEAHAEARRTADASAEDRLWDADLAMERADFERAVNLYTDVLDRDPGNNRALQSRALVFERLGRLDEAIADHRLLAALDPQNAIHHYHLGVTLAAADRLDEGERSLRRALELDPDEPVLFEGLADCFLERGRAAAIEGRAAEAERAFRQAEDHARRGLELDRAGPWLAVNLGASLIEQYRLDPDGNARLAEEALTVYDSLLDRLRGDPSPSATDSLVDVLVNTCDLHIQLRHAELALATCSEVVERRPEDAVGFYNLAGAHVLAGRPEDALDALGRDLELGDTEWQALEQDPWFAPLRSDPRFLEIVARMKAAADALTD